MNRTHENSLHTKIGTEWNGMISMWNGPFSKLKKTNKKNNNNKAVDYKNITNIAHF